MPSLIEFLTPSPSSTLSAGFALAKSEHPSPSTGRGVTNFATHALLLPSEGEGCEGLLSAREVSRSWMRGILKHCAQALHTKKAGHYVSNSKTCAMEFSRAPRSMEATGISLT